MEYIVINGKLYHHGTKGMKWGKRLYQRKDGSLTALGRIRYGKKGPPDKSTDSTNDAAKILKKEEPRKISKNPKKMSDAELVSAVDRLNLQKRYKDLNKEVNMSRPRKFVGDFIDKAAMPAAIDAGKKLMTDKLIDLGKKKLGLNPEQAKDAFAELKKEKEFHELTSSIAKAKYLTQKYNRDRVMGEGYKDGVDDLYKSARDNIDKNVHKPKDNTYRDGQEHMDALNRNADIMKEKSKNDRSEGEESTAVVLKRDNVSKDTDRSESVYKNHKQYKEDVYSEYAPGKQDSDWLNMFKSGKEETSVVLNRENVSKETTDKGRDAVSRLLEQKKYQAPIIDLWPGDYEEERY